MNTSSNAAARVVNGTKIYGEGETEVRALDGVDVEFQTGEFTAIMGPSGSGKSTLMHCVAGLDVLTTGQSFINDVSLNDLSDRELTLLRRDKIGFVFIWMDQVVASVGLGDRLNHRPDELSGGQQQRVAVARALVSQPAIVFADEPTGNLDSITGNEVLEFLRSAVDDLNQTLVMVTHDAAAASRADRVLFLADGKIVEELSAPSSEEIFDTLKRLDG